MDEVMWENQGERLTFSTFLSSWIPLWKMLRGNQGATGRPGRVSEGSPQHTQIQLWTCDSVKARQVAPDRNRVSPPFSSQRGHPGCACVGRGDKRGS